MSSFPTLAEAAGAAGAAGASCPSILPTLEMALATVTAPVRFDPQKHFPMLPSLGHNEIYYTYFLGYLPLTTWPCRPG